MVTPSCQGELGQHPLLLATDKNIQDNLRYCVFGVEVGDKKSWVGMVLSSFGTLQSGR